MKRDKIEFIQALRGVAALLVVLYHGLGYFPGGYTAGSIPFTLLMPGGTMGVDVFFIISGFIMVHTTWHVEGSAPDVAGFLIKRVARILPVYIVVTLLSVSLAHGFSYFHSATNWEALARAFAFQPAGDVNNAPRYGDEPLDVGWTLNYEMYFYLIFGLCMLCGRRLRWIALGGISILTLIIYPHITRGTFSTNVYGVYNFEPFYVNLITNPIIWLFMAGAGIGIAYRLPFKVPSPLALRLIAAASIAFVIWQYLSEWQMNHGIFLWGVSLVPMVFCLSLADRAKPFKVPAPLVRLGDISYSLYLIDLPVKFAFAMLMPETLRNSPLFLSHRSRSPLRLQRFRITILRRNCQSRCWRYVSLVGHRVRSQ